MYESQMTPVEFLLKGKTENVVFPSRFAFCWKPFKFADVLSEKYLAEAKIKSINNGNSWHPLPIKFDKERDERKKKKKKVVEKYGEKLTEKDSQKIPFIFFGSVP